MALLISRGLHPVILNLASAKETLTTASQQWSSLLLPYTMFWILVVVRKKISLWK
jgi:hypothetical protein